MNPLGTARHLLIGTAAAAFDVAMTRATQAATRASRRRGPESFGHEERLTRLTAVAEHYGRAEGRFFREARPIDPTQVPAGDGVTDLLWPSDYSPWSEGLEGVFENALENHTAAARLITPSGRRAGGPRPAIILIHGYLGGNFAAERRFFPVDWLLGLGLDVVLFTLPFHGHRAEAKRRIPRFPGSDPRLTNEGFRQAMGDLADLVDFLLRRGHGHVGLLGMSLGGYSTALAATLDPRLAFAVPLIPLASFADWALEQGRFSAGPGAAEAEHAALDAVHRIISPLHRTPLLGPERMLVVAAAADRITPIRHAERIAQHFRAPLHTFPGGHLLQVGRDRRLHHLAVMLRDLGILPRSG